VNVGNFFAELKGRNVIRMAGLYLVGAWLVVQVAGTVLPMFGAPDWLPRTIVVLLAIGFVPAVIFSWVFEITPEGLKREEDVAPERSITPQTGRRMDRTIIVVLALALGYFAFDKFVLTPRREAALMARAVPNESKSTIDPKSIAVLPFVNMSDDKANDYFSDGISEELLNLLAKVPQLKVTARVSSFSFKGKEVDIPEIARRLHVSHVLEGSVRKAGDQVRITAQLIHAADGFHMWSETYDRKLDDIFKIQDEVAAKVVKELKVTLLEPQPKVRTTDPKAYALYLQAKQLGRQSTAEAYEKSDALYHQVLEIDPRYVPAWDRLAANFINKVRLSMVSSQEGYARAREALEKALAIDPEYTPAHGKLGSIANDQNDDAGAAKHFERALALDPTDPDMVGNAASFLMSLGRVDEALGAQEAVVRRDPVNTTALHNLGLNQRCSGKYDEAITSFRTALSLDPGIGEMHSQLSMVLLLKGDAAGALAEIKQEPNESSQMIGLPMAYYALGRKADSDSALSSLIAKYEKDTSYNIAYIYAFRGEADKAFAWLDKALEYHDPGLSEIVSDNLFDKIRSDPRWLPFLRKLGKAPEQLAKIQFKVTLPPQ
jgi:TolB-like protein/Flp pilus assembly protein TadD